MKYALLTLAFALTISACKTVTGVVTDEQGTPVRDAMVSIDCARTAIRTAQSGHFRFKTRAKGKKCTIRVWQPGDTLHTTIVQEYTYKAGAVKLTLLRRKE